LRWLAPVISVLVQAERHARPVLAGVESLEIGPGRATLVYHGMELAQSLVQPVGASVRAFAKASRMASSSRER